MCRSEALIQERCRSLLLSPQEGHEDDQKAGPPLLQGKVEGSGHWTKPGKEFAPKRDFSVAFQNFKDTYKLKEDQPFTKSNSNRTKEKVFKLKKGRSRVGRNSSKNDETLEQAAQRICGYLIPDGVQGQDR